MTLEGMECHHFPVRSTVPVPARLSALDKRLDRAGLSAKLVA